MHILHVETGRNFYGGALQVNYLLQGLQKRGVRNSLVCSSNSEIADAARPFASIYSIPIMGELDPSLAFSIRRIVLQEKPDLIHVHSRRGADLWGGLAASLSRTPAVATRRVDNPEFSSLARFKYSFYRVVITISRGIRKVLMGEGIRNDKIICVPSAVDHALYATAPDKEWFCREFGIKPTTKSVGIIAQMISRKGHHDLIEAIPEILRQQPETNFLFFGKGPLREKLERECRENQIQDQVHFAGFRNDMEKILPCLDLVVHPARMEGLGVSLLQAAAASVPIVASSVGGIPELVLEGENGYLFEAGDIQGLAERTVVILGNPEMARSMGKKGRQIVQSRFSIPAMVEGNVAAYQYIFGLSPKRITPMIYPLRAKTVGAGPSPNPFNDK